MKCHLFTLKSGFMVATEEKQNRTETKHGNDKAKPSQANAKRILIAIVMLETFARCIYDGAQ